MAVLSEGVAPSAPLTPASPFDQVSGLIHRLQNGGDITHMPLYRFAFYDGDWHDDPYGTVLDDDDAAHKEALRPPALGPGYTGRTQFPRLPAL